MNTATMTACGACDAQISSQAISCPHCGHPAEATPAVTSNNGAIGSIAASIPFGAALLVWFWVGKMNLFQRPADSLSTLMYATVGSTAVLIASILIWFLAFPMYMQRRKKYGQRSLLAVALLGMVAFGVSWVLMGQMIDTSVDRIRQGLGR